MTLLLTIVIAYLAIGIVFAIAFVTIGVGRIDPAARGGPIAFRLLILPGCVGLWPFMAIQWMQAKRDSEADG